MIRIRRFGCLISEEFIRPCFFVLSNRFVFVASILNRIMLFPSVTSWLSHCPAPRSWFNSIRIAYSRYSFGLFLTDSFLRTSSLSAFCYSWFSLTGVIFDPVVANIFAVFSLSRRTGLVLPAVIGWFSFLILPLQVISFRNLSSRNAWFQFAF